MADQDNLTRRELIQLTAAASVAGAVAPSGLASEPALKFFSKEEFAMVDELSELIIPTDEHSPGARAAQVAAYIDGQLAESFDDAPKHRWHEGLARINSLSQEMYGRPFMQATPDAYYTSKIGIHQEMEYKGNVLLQEFVGYEVK